MFHLTNFVQITLLKTISPGTWQAFARPAKKLQPGDRISFAEDFTAKVAALQGLWNQFTEVGKETQGLPRDFESADVLSLLMEDGRPFFDRFVLILRELIADHLGA